MTTAARAASLPSLSLPPLLTAGFAAALSWTPFGPAGGTIAAAPPVEASRPRFGAVSVDEARDRARSLQEAYEATLVVIHRRYFDADEKDAIPARALEDVFRSVDEATGGETRWMAVNTPAMNVDHAPGPGFEADAAEALAAGANEFERVEGGAYRRAGAVPLTASCLKCHLSGLTKQVRNRRVAALVIRIPVERK